MQALVTAVAYNAAFGRLKGAPLPFFLDDVVSLLAGAFAPGVFFLAGTASVGSFSQLARLDSAWLPLALALLKSPSLSPHACPQPHSRHRRSRR